MKIDHVGIIVHDLAAAKAFFLDLSLEMVGEATAEGEWVGRVIGLQNVRSDVAMLRTPDGDTRIELIRFHTPADEKGIQRPLANTPGIRHLAFEVEDVIGLVAKLKLHGAELVGEIQTYENTYRLCYLRGPEGIILELAERLE